MEKLLDSGLVWWVTVIDIPAMSALFWMFMKHRKDQDMQLREINATLEVRCSQLREALAAFKLEVARNYASITEMKDLEVRLVSHLVRIESKLDKTAIKAASMGSK